MGKIKKEKIDIKPYNEVVIFTSPNGIKISLLDGPNKSEKEYELFKCEEGFDYDRIPEIVHAFDTINQVIIDFISNNALNVMREEKVDNKDNYCVFEDSNANKKIKVCFDAIYRDLSKQAANRLFINYLTRRDNFLKQNASSNLVIFSADNSYSYFHKHMDKSFYTETFGEVENPILINITKYPRKQRIAKVDSDFIQGYIASLLNENTKLDDLQIESGKRYIEKEENLEVKVVINGTTVVFPINVLPDVLKTLEDKGALIEEPDNGNPELILKHTESES